MFGKIINGELIKAPNKIKHKGRVYYNPKDDVYIDAGYYPIIETDIPEELYGKRYKVHYELVEGQIIQTWVEDDSIEEEMVGNIPENVYTLSYKEEVVARIRAVYSIDDEIAILRQRDVKPDEFAEYYAFVEQCKAEIKAELEI
jgi:hypothetical protein